MTSSSLAPTPLGQRAAVAAAKMNKRVVVVEARTVVGGVCINTGTIPSKTMREAVLHLSGYNYRSVYGINYRVKEKITMADLAFRVQAVIKTEIDVTEAQLSRNGIDVVHGMAHFVSPTQVRVEGIQAETNLEADRIIIAVGTKPACSPKVPLNGKTILNSDQILGLGALPQSLIVVGGGVVGVEYTCMFAVLGVRASTLIEKRDRSLGPLTANIIEALKLTPWDADARHSPPRRRSRKRGRAPQQHRRRQSRKQEARLRRRSAVCRRPSGRRGRAQPSRSRTRGRLPRPHRRR